jgi:Ca2+-binding RTX toxin-like protein
VRAFLIGCAVLLLGVGCAGTSSESSKTEEQGRSPQATASQEARCEGTRTIARRGYVYTRHREDFLTNDLQGCPKGGLLSGTGGKDNLYGGDGEDKVHGLGGSDQLQGGVGKDVLYGGPGKDIQLNAGKGDDVIYGGPGEEKNGLQGAGGEDVLYGGPGDDNALGGGGADVIYGGDGNDGLDGGWGDHGARDKLYCVKEGRILRRQE